MAEDLPRHIPRRTLPIAAGIAYRELQELERLLIKADMIADETADTGG